MDLAIHASETRTTPYKFKREGFVPYKGGDRDRTRQNVAPSETEEPLEEV